MLSPAAGSSDCSDLPLEHMYVSESKYVSADHRAGSAPNHFHGKTKRGKRVKDSFETLIWTLHVLTQ